MESMKTNTRPMKVEQIAFLLDRLAADTPPNQQIRELTENAIDAIKRRWKAGDRTPGKIRWDVDWFHLEQSGTYKLSITDNGDGMTGEDMTRYLNALAVCGAHDDQGLNKHFGVGAKITALHTTQARPHLSIVGDGRGAMVKLHRDEAANVYGMESIDLQEAAGFVYPCTKT